MKLLAPVALCEWKCTVSAEVGGKVFWKWSKLKRWCWLNDGLIISKWIRLCCGKVISKSKNLCYGQYLIARSFLIHNYSIRLWSSIIAPENCELVAYRKNLEKSPPIPPLPPPKKKYIYIYMVSKVREGIWWYFLPSFFLKHWFFYKFEQEFLLATHNHSFKIMKVQKNSTF